MLAKRGCFVPRRTCETRGRDQRVIARKYAEDVVDLRIQTAMIGDGASAQTIAKVARIARLSRRLWRFIARSVTAVRRRLVLVGLAMWTNGGFGLFHRTLSAVSRPANGRACHQRRRKEHRNQATQKHSALAIRLPDKQLDESNNPNSTSR